jgi:predicted small metal-binding protein
MAKILRCGDLMPGCEIVVEGKDVAEVMVKIATHARTDHGLKTLPPVVTKKIKGAIEDK